MRMQKPYYEEGSILRDAPQHDTMDEQVELARDKEEWQGTANAIYPAKRLTTAVLERSGTPRSKNPAGKRAHSPGFPAPRCEVCLPTAAGSACKLDSFKG